MTVLDIFSGLGGWDVAARELGFEPLGIEIDAAACATREAAGLHTLRGDVAAIDPKSFDLVRAIIGSPPCQTFSTAGKRAGLADAEVLEAALQRIEAGLYDTLDLGDRAVGETTWSDAAARCSDARSALVLEPLRWALAHRDTLQWIALEQVPPVLPYWRRFAAIFELWGFTTWTGILNAADYGVPQTRRRAILIASRNPHCVARPAPTHCDPRKALPLFGNPWVSMAEALVWDDDQIVRTRSERSTPGGNTFGSAKPSWALTGKTRSWTREQPATTLVASGRTAEGGRVRPGIRALRSSQTIAGGPKAERDIDEPSVTVGRNFDRARLLLRNNSQSKSATRSIDEPAGTLFFGARLNDVAWITERPATTVVADPRLGPPGHRDRSKDGPHRQDGGIAITEREALILQSFPPDYPVQGSRTKRFEQIGNAIPPGLAYAILAPLMGAAEAAA
jgi:DNA (cytosine-5)-methyltransferase 1